MGRLDRTACFDASHGLKQLGRLDRADRHTAKPREHVLLQTDESAGGMPCTYLGKMNRVVPLARHGFEAVGHHLGPAGLLGTTRLAWIYAVGQERVRPVSLVSRRQDSRRHRRTIRARKCR